MLLGGASLEYLKKKFNTISFNNNGVEVPMVPTFQFNNLPAINPPGQLIYVTGIPNSGSQQNNGCLCISDGDGWLKISDNTYVEGILFGNNIQNWTSLKSAIANVSGITYLGDPNPSENFSNTTGPQSGILFSPRTQVTGNFNQGISSSYFVMEFTQGMNTGQYGGYAISSATGPLLALTTDNNQSVTISQLTGQHDCYQLPNGKQYIGWADWNNNGNPNGVYKAWLRKAVFKITSSASGITVDITICTDSGNILLQQLGYQIPGATKFNSYTIGSIDNGYGSGTVMKDVYIFRQTTSDPTSIPYATLLNTN